VLIGAESVGERVSMRPPLLISTVLQDETDLHDDQGPLVPWWSITKAVLASAVLRLVELGTVDLDDCFDDWPFTIRQLLQHTSGLTDYGGPLYRQAVSAGETVWSVDDLLRRRKARELQFTPGEGWAYSNIGYLFLRQLIERTTGSDLGTALNRLIFGPLRVARTRLAVGPGDMIQTLWGNANNYDPRWVFHGLLIGPPVDAVTFLARLLEGKLLSSQLLAAMREARVLGGAMPGRPWTATGYGLGLMIGTMSGVGRVVGHSGAGHDTVSALYAFLDLPGRPVAAAFAQGTNEGIAEHEAVRRALSA
jgi:CubicO group peptidase (beta-lactamase class C family)